MDSACAHPMQQHRLSAVHLPRCHGLTPVTLLRGAWLRRGRTKKNSCLKGPSQRVPRLLLLILSSFPSGSGCAQALIGAPSTGANTGCSCSHEAAPLVASLAFDMGTDPVPAISSSRHRLPRRTCLSPASPSGSVKQRSDDDSMTPASTRCFAFARDSSNASSIFPRRWWFGVSVACANTYILQCQSRFKRGVRV